MTMDDKERKSMCAGSRRKSTPRDFSCNMSPLLVKELRQGLRMKGFVLFTAFFPFILAVPFLVYFRLGEGIFSVMSLHLSFWGVAFVFFLLFNPLRALCYGYQEKITQNQELIEMASCSPAGMFSDKWISYALQTGMVGLVLLPFFILRYFMGAVELVTEFRILFCLVVGSLILTAIGLLMSGLPILFRFLLFFILIVFMFYQFVVLVVL